MVIASRIGEPGHVSVLPANYPLVVCAELIVSKETNAAGGELIDHMVDVINNEVEKRERRRDVVLLRVDQHVAVSC